MTQTTVYSKAVRYAVIPNAVSARSQYNSVLRHIDSNLYGIYNHKVPICSICNAYILHDKSVAPEHTHRYLDCDDSCLIHHTVTFRACCSPAVPAAFREACTVSLMTRGEHRAARGDDAQRARYFCCSRASQKPPQRRYQPVPCVAALRTANKPHCRGRPLRGPTSLFVIPDAVADPFRPAPTLHCCARLSHRMDAAMISP